MKELEELKDVRVRIKVDLEPDFHTDTLRRSPQTDSAPTWTFTQGRPKFDWELRCVILLGRLKKRC